VPAGSLVVITPGRDLRSAHVGDFRSLEIVASEDLLYDAGLLAESIDPRSLPPERCILPLDPALLADFSCLATQLAGIGEMPTAAPPSKERAADIQHHTLGLVGRALRGHKGPWAQPVPRYSLAAAALKLVEQNGESRLKVRNLAEALGVTPRALEYAFQSSLGVSPAHYLRARALNAVRRDLLANRHRTVTTAALRHGFDHLGRFSGQYQRLFEELPSRTRRAAG
jgi:AraC-like DNA-binding protein